MPTIRKSTRQQAVKRTQIKRVPRAPLAVFVLALGLFSMLAGAKFFLPAPAVHPPADATALAPVMPVSPSPALLAPIVSAVNAPEAELLTGDPIHAIVGLVAGHKGYDPGAVCDDGLTEAEINYAVAQEVVNLLSRRGVDVVHLLEEFDPNLSGFRADALVSIHADSCNVPGASGFKVARVTDSAIPEAEDRLVACLNQEYGRYTGLPQHPASITDNMTDYHAFREIDSLTPGAIIEIGFLLDNRYLLESKPKIVARGIAAGILCFLEK